jgi:hypothetical protein
LACACCAGSAPVIAMRRRSEAALEEFFALGSPTGEGLYALRVRVLETGVVAEDERAGVARAEGERHFGRRNLPGPDGRVLRGTNCCTRRRRQHHTAGGSELGRPALPLETADRAGGPAPGSRRSALVRAGRRPIVRVGAEDLRDVKIPSSDPADPAAKRRVGGRGPPRD